MPIINVKEGYLFIKQSGWQHVTCLVSRETVEVEWDDRSQEAVGPSYLQYSGYQGIVQ